MHVEEMSDHNRDDALNLLARFFPLSDGTKPVSRQGEAESTRGGVESAPGKKDAAKVRAFIAAARAA